MAAYSAANEGKQDSLNDKKKRKLSRLGSFSSTEVFYAWTEDSLLKASTIETLVEVHEIDCLPAVLALRSRDIAALGLSIGQARLFEDAVMKLHSQYEYEEPPSPSTTVDVEFPRYKSLLEDTTSEVVDGSRHSVKTNGHEFSYNNDDHSGTEKKLLHDKECDEDETQSGCACERWLFVVIFMPILLLISLLGFIAWIFVWPVNKFLRGEKESNTIYQTTENLMQSPLTAFHWATGRRENDLESKKEDEGTKLNYGGTDVVEMKELEKAN